MRPRAIHECRYDDLQAVVLENDQLRAVILPELGAKIYDLVYKPAQKDLLWHNPRIKPRKVPFGVAFDDVWSGGWDEIFPNDAVSVVGGERYPDMGEIWSIPWDYSITETEHTVALRTFTWSPITPCEISRTIAFNNDEAVIRLQYSLKNTSHLPLRFLWKLHPAFDINETCTIEVPAETGIVDPRYRSSYSASSYEYDWPNATTSDGLRVDVSRVPPPTSHTCTLHYVTQLSDGWVKLRNPRDHVTATIRFPKEVFNNIWLFLAYGGWRSLYTAVIEPSTSYPYDLAQAIKEGQCSRLDPNMELSCEIEVELSTIT